MYFLTLPTGKVFILWVNSDQSQGPIYKKPLKHLNINNFNIEYQQICVATLIIILTK